jgi:hypothetical protein
MELYIFYYSYIYMYLNEVTRGERGYTLGTEVLECAPNSVGWKPNFFQLKW